MKNMLIIHPHWPPSNTVGVHRVRLIANELHHFNWNATVLTVDERDIEDDLSPDLEQLVDGSVEVIKVRARPVFSLMGKRLIGDIGLRAYGALKRKAEAMLATSPFDFVWFSLPSWYTPLMGPGLNKKFGTPYGVDYRDPWMYQLAPEQQGFNRALATVTLARILEPIALSRVSLISGVNDAYLSGISSRYPNLEQTQRITFQMGFRKEDHHIELNSFTPPFDEGHQTFVYAGAYSPNWYPLFRIWMEGLAKLNQREPLQNVQFLFIGTHNPSLQSITELASEFGITPLVRELPDRIPFLEVQQILREAQGSMVIGSTEPHYSASKLFQCLVTSPRTFAFFHEHSEGREILDLIEATQFFVGYSNEKSHELLVNEVASRLEAFLDPAMLWTPRVEQLEPHTSRANASKFLAAVEEVISSNG